MKFKFSKSSRFHLIVADLAYMLAENLSINNKLNSKERACVIRIKKRVKNIQTLFLGHNPDGDPAQLRQYSRLISELYNFIQSLEMSNLSFEYFNAILVLIEDARDNVKDSKKEGKREINKDKLYREWSYMAGTMMTLYKYADPEIETYAKFEKNGELITKNVMEDGVAIAKKITSIISRGVFDVTKKRQRKPLKLQLNTATPANEFDKYVRSQSF